MKRRDFIILAIVLVASLTLYLLRPKAVDEASGIAYLRISIAGETQELIPLTEEREIRIEQENGDYNVVRDLPRRVPRDGGELLQPGLHPTGRGHGGQYRGAARWPTRSSACRISWCFRLSPSR